MIHILITEDSDVVATLLKAIFDAEPDLKVVGRARNGHEAVTLTHQLKPDLVTMDIRMPVMDGFEATRMIMSTDPTPIVVVSSSVNNEELRITFRAIEEGALAVIEKPHGVHHPHFAQVRTNLVETIRAMSEVKLVRRRCPKPTHRIFETQVTRHTAAYKVVGLACSTGGPQALAVLLSGLPIGFPLPLLVVQHISPGFIEGLANWLRGHTLLEVKLAADGMPILPGTVYFAPDNFHLGVEWSGKQLIATLSKGRESDRFCPSGSNLFRSLADCCPTAAIGGILTGMGNDGVAGMKALHAARGTTFAQDEESSVVFGMPGVAVAEKCVDSVIPLANIAQHLTELARN